MQSVIVEGLLVHGIAVDKDIEALKRLVESRCDCEARPMVKGSGESLTTWGSLTYT